MYLLLEIESCLAKSARCYKAELFYDVVKSKKRHWLAVTLSFTPCGDRQTDFFSVFITCVKSILCNKRSK